MPETGLGGLIACTKCFLSLYKWILKELEHFRWKGAGTVPTCQHDATAHESEALSLLCVLTCVSILWNHSPEAFIARLLSLWKESLYCIHTQQCMTAPKVWDVGNGAMCSGLEMAKQHFSVYFFKCIRDWLVYRTVMSSVYNSVLFFQCYTERHEQVIILPRYCWYQCCLSIYLSIYFYLSCFWGRGLVIPYLPLVEWIYKVWYIAKYSTHY